MPAKFPEPRPPSLSGLVPHPGGVSLGSKTLPLDPRVPPRPQTSLLVLFPLAGGSIAGLGFSRPPRHQPPSRGRSCQSWLSGLQDSDDQGLPVKEGLSLNPFLKAGLDSRGVGRGPGLEAVDQPALEATDQGSSSRPQQSMAGWRSHSRSWGVLGVQPAGSKVDAVAGPGSSQLPPPNTVSRPLESQGPLRRDPPWSDGRVFLGEGC